jgi:hypothetical protein
MANHSLGCDSLTVKNNLTYGISVSSGCSGVISAIPRLNFPGLCLSDAGNGVRGTDFVNGYPSGLMLAQAGIKIWQGQGPWLWEENSRPKV